MITDAGIRSVSKLRHSRYQQVHAPRIRSYNAGRHRAAAPDTAPLRVTVCLSQKEKSWHEKGFGVCGCQAGWKLRKQANERDLCATKRFRSSSPSPRRLVGRSCPSPIRGPRSDLADSHQDAFLLPCFSSFSSSFCCKALSNEDISLNGFKGVQ